MIAMRRLIFSLIISATVWTVMTWPLTLHFNSGIAASHHRGDYPVREMIPGDHLQLLYHFWLFGDMVTGHTPWFTNLYEFNTGVDEDRFELTYNFLPFSLLCAVLSWLGGQAFGWNMTAFLSIWLTYWLTWLLTARYTRSEVVAAVAALPGIVLTYRWFALLGGSPTGFGMMWTPMLMLGLDAAVRDQRVSGGLWAGLALFFAGISDTHVYFFLVLFTPIWCVISFTLKPDFRWAEWRAYRRTLLALMPAVLLGGLSILKSKLLARELSDSIMAHGRRLGEVAAFSPRPEGLLSRAPLHVHSQAFIGWTVPLLILLGLITILILALRKRPVTWRPALFSTLVIAAAAGIVLLALGPHAPHEARLFVYLREWIPPYAMIRQAAKIYCLLPQLMAVALAVGLPAMLAGFDHPKWRHTAVILAGILMLLDFRGHIDPLICLLRDEQAAYAAIADDARSRGVAPRALIVVLWPGDSHYASVYQHFISKYRIRMLNGYRPAVPQEYRDEIFWPYQSINQGLMTDEQADGLLDMGVQYLLVHEDLFPEQVSPFPVTFTLKHLRTHPRLAFMEQADRVWAFRVLPEPEPPREDPLPAWNTWFPARLWNVEQHRRHETDFFPHFDGAGTGYLAFNRPDAAVLLQHTSSPPAPDLRWMIRVRGKGRLRAMVMVRDQVHHEDELQIISEDWTWVDFLFPTKEQLRVSLRMEWLAGEVEVDMALLTAGSWQPPMPGETLELPAPLFFHAGYTDHQTGHLVFKPLSEPRRRILYGPRLPFDAGVYVVEMLFDTDAPSGTVLGRLRFETEVREADEKQVDVVAGKPIRARVEHPANLPLTFSFDYDRTGRMEIRSFRIHREAMR